MNASRSTPDPAEILPPAPRENPLLLGHAPAERRLIAAHGSGRLPHAWLIAGPNGIGKATLAFRFARWLLSRGDDVDDGPSLFAAPSAPPSDSLFLDPEDRIFRMVASGGHPGVLTIERGINPQRKRRYSEIRVDDVRKLADFMHLTTAQGGWRVVVVDSADEMNRNAANAILKLLEEPPKRAVILLVSHAPGGLLPTIRSRCRMLRLEPLAVEIVVDLLQRFLPELPPDTALPIAVLAEGSIGRALMLADQNGLATVAAILEVLRDAPRIDRRKLAKLADQWARPAKEGEADPFDNGAELLLWWAQRALRMAVAPIPGGPVIDGEDGVARALVGRLGEAGLARRIEETDRFLSRGSALNQDKRQMAMDAFLRLAG